MATALRNHNREVRDLARRILCAHQNGQQAAAREELAKFKSRVSQLRHLDTLDSEKLEVLETALDYLESPVMEQARAANRLLEHLSANERPLKPYTLRA